MSTRRRAGILMLNAGLAALVAGLWWSQPGGAALGWAGLGPAFASAQGGAAQRTRGQYLMVSGRVQGSTSNVVYVVDVMNQELLALRWDRSAQRLQALGWRDLAKDGGGPGSGRASSPAPAGGGR